MFQNQFGYFMGHDGRDYGRGTPDEALSSSRGGGLQSLRYPSATERQFSGPTKWGIDTPWLPLTVLLSALYLYTVSRTRSFHPSLTIYVLASFGDSHDIFGCDGIKTKPVPGCHTARLFRECRFHGDLGSQG